MSNTTDPSLSEAQELVGRIAKSYGWLADSVREVTPPDALTAIANLQTVLGAAARTYVTLNFGIVSPIILKFCVVWQRIFTKAKLDSCLN